MVVKYYKGFILKNQEGNMKEIEKLMQRVDENNVEGLHYIEDYEARTFIEFEMKANAKLWKGIEKAKSVLNNI